MSAKKSKRQSSALAEWIAKSLLSSLLRAIGRAGIFAWRWARRTAFLGFVMRYWWLFVFLGIAVSLIFWKIAFDILGTMIYVPALTIVASLSSLAVRNVVHRETTDADADSGYTAREWKKLSGRDRVIWAKVELLGYFLGACLIASALAR